MSIENYVAIDREELARLRADSAVVARICELFKIGINARSAACIMANVENTNRFAEKLHAIEREFFMVPGEPDEDFPDEEVQPDCLLNCWGHTTEQYVERFREVLPRVAIPEGFALVPVEMHSQSHWSALDQIVNGTHLDDVPNHDDDSLGEILRGLPVGSWRHLRLEKHLERATAALAAAPKGDSHE